MNKHSLKNCRRVISENFKKNVRGGLSEDNNKR